MGRAPESETGWPEVLGLGRPILCYGNISGVHSRHPPKTVLRTLTARPTLYFTRRANRVPLKQITLRRQNERCTFARFPNLKLEDIYRCEYQYPLI